MSAAPGTALILGAGFGTRMGRLTERTPKPLLPVGGRALLDRAIDRVIEAGTERVVVNVHAHADQMRAHLALRADVPISVSIEREILETGGGARKALPLIGGGTFLAHNTDIVWTGTKPLAPLLEAWSTSGDRLDALLLLMPTSMCIAHEGGGDFALGPEGAIRRAAGEPGAFVFTGAQIIRCEALAARPPGAWSFNAWWDGLIASGRIGGVAGSNAPFIDVGTPEGLATAERFLNPG